MSKSSTSTPSKADKLKAAYEAADDASKQVSEHLSGLELTGVRRRVENHFATILRFIASVSPKEEKARQFGKVKNMLGRPVEVKKTAMTPADHAHTATVLDRAKEMNEKAQRVQDQELKMKIDRLYAVFPELEFEKIVNDYSDLEIRGVARKAGLPVKEQVPARVDDIHFIKQVRDAIMKKEKIEEIKSQVATGSIPGDVSAITPEAAIKLVNEYLETLPEDVDEVRINPRLAEAVHKYMDSMIGSRPDGSQTDNMQPFQYNDVQFIPAEDVEMFDFTASKSEEELMEAVISKEEELRLARENKAHHMTIKKLEKELDDVRKAAGLEGGLDEGDESGSEDDLGGGNSGQGQ